MSQVYQLSRLEFVRIPLSKRKLTKMIDTGKSNGCDDPRSPTVQGICILRDGLQVQALKEFVYERAVRKGNHEQEWIKLCTFNRHILDRIAHKYCAVECAKDVKSQFQLEWYDLQLTNVDKNSCFIPLLQKPAHISDSVSLEQFDGEKIESYKPNKIVLMNLRINKSSRRTVSNSNTKYLLVIICVSFYSNFNFCYCTCIALFCHNIKSMIEGMRFGFSLIGVIVVFVIVVFCF